MALCRPNQLCDDAGESITVVVFVGGVHLDAGVASSGFERDAMGQGSMWYDPSQALEDRGSSSCDGSQGMGVVFRELFLSAVVPTGLREPCSLVSDAATLLTAVKVGQKELRNTLSGIGPS